MSFPSFLQEAIVEVDSLLDNLNDALRTVTSISEAMKETHVHCNSAKAAGTVLMAAGILSAPLAFVSMAANHAIETVRSDINGYVLPVLFVPTNASLYALLNKDLQMHWPYMITRILFCLFSFKRLYQHVEMRCTENQ